MIRCFSNGSARLSTFCLLLALLLLPAGSHLSGCTRTVVREVRVPSPQILPHPPTLPSLQSFGSMSPGDRFLWRNFVDEYGTYLRNLRTIKDLP